MPSHHTRPFATKKSKTLGKQSQCYVDKEARTAVGGGGREPVIVYLKVEGLGFNHNSA